MALLKCSECGHDVSSKAPACPRCGCPVDALEQVTPTSATVDSYSSKEPIHVAKQQEILPEIDVFGAIVGWLLGIPFLFLGMLFLLTGMIASREALIFGSTFVSIATLLLPPVRRKTYSLTHVTLSGKVRTIIVLFLLGMVFCMGIWGVVWSEESRDTEQAEERKIAEVARIEQLKEDYKSNRITILDNIKKSIKDGDFKSAIKTASTYTALDESEIETLLVEATSKKEEADRQAEIVKLKAELAELETSNADIDSIVAKHERLLELVPNDPELIAKHKKFLANQKINKTYRTEAGMALHAQILDRHPTIDPYYRDAVLWGSLTAKPLAAISVPISDWQALSESERRSLEAYAASLISKVKTSPLKHSNTPATAPTASKIRANVSTMTSASWGILVGHTTPDGHYIYADKFVSSGH